MSHISKISIKNYRGIKELHQDFGDEKFIILIGRGDSGKSTILSAIYAALSPSWNMTFSDLDFYKQDTSKPIEIELEIRELPDEFLTEKKFGLYLQNGLEDEDPLKYYIIINLTVDETLEPHWTVKPRPESAIEAKPISGNDRALLGANYITDYTDHQFAYNRQSPLYALTKSKLEEGKNIERIKSELIRIMTGAIKDEHLNPLNGPMAGLMETAHKLGLEVFDLCAHIDIKENPYTGNSIALHTDSLPYRLRGKGSKRLMSIAIQSELTKQGGVILVDEIEQGLEPDRIVTLIRILKETQKGQVFITTHSINVILEANWHNLFVLNKGAQILSHLDNTLENCRRSNPQAFFAKHIICCEGKTEVGFMRVIDTWIREIYGSSFSAKGVVIVNAEGGNKMYTYAEKLKTLGFDACVFADDDKPKDLKKFKEHAKNSGVELFLCDEGNCLERQIYFDLPWSNFLQILNCDQSDFPSKRVKVDEDLREEINNAKDIDAQNVVRDKIATLSTVEHHEWFKHIPGGEFLGTTYIAALDDMGESATLKKNIYDLLKWADFEK